MKKIKLPRKRKKRYLKCHSKADYKLSIMASEILMESDDRQRGFKFHSKFPMKYGEGMDRFKAIRYW